MKGTIVSAWIETCTNLYGEDTTNQALESVGINSDKIFKPSEDIDDQKAFGFIENLSSQINKDKDELWTLIGRNNAITYSKRYPSFFKFDNLYSFLRSMYDIHVVITERMPGSKPPLLRIEPTGSHTARMSYESPRKMFPFFKGMLMGAAEFFEEEITIDIVSQSGNLMEIDVGFPKQIYEREEFRLNKVLSFGFIKTLPGKVAASTLLFLGIPTGIIHLLLGAKFSFLVGSILSIVVPYAVTKGLLKPMSTIKTNIDQLKNKDFSFESHMTTNDFLEELNEDLIAIKDSIKEDFVGYNGSSDEMNVFVDNFEEISKKMADTSNDVDNIMTDLSKGIYRQSSNTDSLSERLNSSINSLSTIVDKEMEGKDQLESVVIDINKGFTDLETSTENLNKVLIGFGNVEARGQSLQDKAQEVREIIETVDGIANQTNLLALNASIEASRAGEFGQGFSVVASEIRKLAEHSQTAVNTINDNLESFIMDIDEFISDISDQYHILEGENNSLNSVAEENVSSVQSIDGVSNLITELTNKLNNEAQNLSDLTSNIEDLASIAHDNSDHSERVVANIEDYTREIRNMTNNIYEFKSLTEQFNNELSKYIL